MVRQVAGVARDFPDGGLDVRRHVRRAEARVRFRRSDLPDKIEALYAKYGVDPGDKIAHLRETLAMRDAALAAWNADRPERGISVSVLGGVIMWLMIGGIAYALVG